MRKIMTAAGVALYCVLLWSGHAYAQTYIVPVTVGSTAYTITVTVASGSLNVVSSSPTWKIGPVTALAESNSAPTQDATARMAAAVAITYDDLFRNNESHVGKVVRYVGQVLQVLDGEGTHGETMMLVDVTPAGYGFWKDPIWVNYAGDKRFLEDDIVTVWGVVDGLVSYNGASNTKQTTPEITSLAVELGELPNPIVPGQVGAPSAAGAGNLRSGPATTFDRIGSVVAGQALKPVAQNSDGSWLQLDSGAWIAAFLVANPPPGLPIAANVPVAPTATPAPPAAAGDTTSVVQADASSAVADSAPTATPASKSIYAIGEEINGNGWTFKVLEIHRRKTVYFYNKSTFAMGNFLVVVVEARNNQSGTDYFDRNVDPYITNDAADVWTLDGATGYARWQYGGLDSTFTDVNPGTTIRLGLAYDLPESTGHILLSTKLPAWVDLGDFSALPLEQ